MLIFTDVDGTLLEADGTFGVPEPIWRDARARHEIILASSRTLAELHEIRAALALDAAVIAEDGAVIQEPGGNPERLGVARSVLIAQLVGVVGEAEADELLRKEPAGQAGRQASLLLPRRLATLDRVARLAIAGLTLTPGGEWATVVAGADKGRAAGVLASRRGVTHWTAIGNGANDAPLLRAAARRFVIRNVDGHHPVLAALPDAFRIDTVGPRGWAAVLQPD